MAATGATINETNSMAHGLAMLMRGKSPTCRQRPQQKLSVYDRKRQVEDLQKK